MGRNILAVVASAISAMLIFFAGEFLNHSMFPFPEGLDIYNPAQLGDFLSDVSMTFWIILIIGYCVGSFVAGYILQKISKTPKLILPIIVGVILTAAGTVNMFMIKHPTWFVVVAILIFIPVVILGNNVAKSK